MSKGKHTRSTQWAMRTIGMISLKIPRKLRVPTSVKDLFSLKPGPAVSGVILEIKNLTNNNKQIMTFVGGGLQAGFFSRTSASLDPSWIQFETEKTYTLEDFEGFARTGGLSLSMGVGWATGFFVFNNIDIKQQWYLGEQINLNGPVGGVAAGLEYYPLGYVTALTKDMFEYAEFELAPGVDSQQLVELIKEPSQDGSPDVWADSTLNELICGLQGSTLPVVTKDLNHQCDVSASPAQTSTPQSSGDTDASNSFGPQQCTPGNDQTETQNDAQMADPNQPNQKEPEASPDEGPVQTFGNSPNNSAAEDPGAIFNSG